MDEEDKRVSRMQFENEVVELDGIEFQDCTFINCDLVYRGGPSFMFIRSPLTGNQLSFCDAARETMNTLAIMHRFGMHDFVEDMIKKVRNPFQDSVQ